MTAKNSNVFDCVIIGAGLGGLRCAVGLHEADVSYLVLEANDEVGGRLVRAPDSFIPGVGIDFGGEAVHGSTTPLNRLCDLAGIPLRSFFTASQGDGGPDDEEVDGKAGYYYYAVHDGEPKRLHRFNELDAEAVRIHDALHKLQDTESLDNLPEAKGAHTLADYLRAHRIPSGIKQLIDAGYSNTVANNSADVLSLRRVFLLERDWNTHDGCDVSSDMGVADPSRCLADTIGYLMSRLDASRVRVSNVVEAVSYDAASGTSKVFVRGSSSPIITRSVVVAVPISKLRAHSIKFQPPLADAKQRAIDAVPTESGRKVILKYRAGAVDSAIPPRKPVWHVDCQNVIMADEMVPEAWFKQNVKSTDGNIYHVAVGFACAKWRNEMARRFGNDDDACLRAFDAQLRKVFGVSGISSDVASFCGGAVYDWTRDAPFVDCAYSTPVIDRNDPTATKYDHFKELAASELSVGRFYAGEHAAFPRAPMTAHAAVYSGQFSAEKVLAFLNTKSPKAKL